MQRPVDRQANIDVFERHARRYDGWFERNRLAYGSELLAIKRMLPRRGRGLEIGVGTGRFAVPLGVRYGVDPAWAMARMARRRGVHVVRATGERLPFPDALFDLVLFVTTICFLRDPVRALAEATRVIRRGGRLVLGMIDGAGSLARSLRSKKSQSPFYRHARFFAVKQVLGWLKRLDYERIETCQTLLKPMREVRRVEEPQDGHGDGAFVVLSAIKRR